MYRTREEAIRKGTDHPEYATYDELEVGMQVICPTEYNGNKEFKNRRGTIVRLGYGWDIRIDWDDPFPFMHSCGGYARLGHGYNSSLGAADLIIIDEFESHSLTQKDVEDILSLI